jgi:hypothetical protein
MFYLIDVSHRVQTFENWEALNEGQSQLPETIRDCIDRLALRVIAEEYSREALGKHHSIAAESQNEP